MSAGGQPDANRMSLLERVCVAAGLLYSRHKGGFSLSVGKVAGGGTKTKGVRAAGRSVRADEEGVWRGWSADTADDE